MSIKRYPFDEKVYKTEIVQTFLVIDRDIFNWYSSDYELFIAMSDCRKRQFCAIFGYWQCCTIDDSQRQSIGKTVLNKVS